MCTLSLTCVFESIFVGYNLIMTLHLFWVFQLVFIHKLRKRLIYLHIHKAKKRRFTFLKAKEHTFLCTNWAGDMETHDSKQNSTLLTISSVFLYRCFVILPPIKSRWYSAVFVYCGLQWPSSQAHTQTHTHTLTVWSVTIVSGLIFSSIQPATLDTIRIHTHMHTAHFLTCMKTRIHTHTHITNVWLSFSCCKTDVSGVSL